MKRTPRRYEVECDAADAGRLAEAIRAYAQAAYPPGGSECAQVARETLFDTAKHCAAHAGGVLVLNKRQLPMLRSALHWWFGEDGRVAADDGSRLRGLLD
jgi:hypothetical protein